MRKVFLFIVLSLFACAFFSAKIIGVGAKLFLKFKSGSELTYQSCKWEKGQLVFSKLTFLNPSFHAHVEKLFVQFDWSSFPKKLKGNLVFDAPHLKVIQEPLFPETKAKWLDFSVSINNGVLDWGNASALLNQQDGKLCVSLDHFNLALLKKWTPHGIIPEGSLSGRVEIDEEGNLFMANLEVAHGAFAFSSESVEGLFGTFSYNTDVGAKWELKGFGKVEEKNFPFFCEGREFKNRWLESEIRFDTSFCKISGDGNWSVVFDGIGPPEVTLLKTALSPLYPTLIPWKMESGVLSGKASFNPIAWDIHFSAKNLGLQRGSEPFFCLEASGDLTEEGGNLFAKTEEWQAQCQGLWEDFSAEVQFKEAHLTLHGKFDGEKLPLEIVQGHFADLEFQGSGWIDSQFNGSFAIEGTWQFLQHKIPFYCPILNKQGDNWAFDCRLQRKTWDFFRLSGIYDGKNIIYQPTSHFLAQPIYFASSSLNELDCSIELPLSALKAAVPLLKEWGVDLTKWPLPEKADLHFQAKPNQLDFTLKSDLEVSARLGPGGSLKGQGKWKELLSTHFEGKIDPSRHVEFSLSDTRLNLEMVGMKGEVFGGGHFIYNGEIEADFDFNVSSLIIDSFPLENEGQIHLSYTPKEGALLHGVQLHGAFDCIVDLLQFDQRSHWIFHNAQIHLPAKIFTHPLLQILDKDKDLDFTANLDFASDFSTFFCTMREGFIPYKGAHHHIENLQLSWNAGKCVAEAYYLKHLIKLDMHIDERSFGRLTIGEEALPLMIDWEYNNALFIQAIEGSFSGIEASFHAESPNVLVGSAHLDFKALQAILPTPIAEGFEEIKMGRGYELKGRLKVENHLPYFSGILSGKGFELFGFQFRTLLAEVDLGPKAMRIYDIKISDSAGMMKIDEILLEDKSPWTISIPNLTIFEMRPSLLQRPGGAVGPIDPLVVRELKITNFQGILDEGKTYTGKGELHFINSYKRGETVFDFPANVLSRIVGLDFELLIPVTGSLNFEIKDGYFNLLELKDAYSEGKRSKFFLEMDPPPRMDLDGNLQIYIKMKQFVLLKITESFLISIDGVLDDPQFRLKKRRFFGLM